MRFRPRSRLALSSFAVGLVVTLPAFAWIAYTTHSAKKGSLAGLTRVPLDKSTNDPLALQSFSFRFENGDHKIRSIGAMPTAGDAEVTFSDVDGKDPYKVSASWLAIPGARPLGAQKWGCVGTCTLAIERPRAGEVFVLSGFNIMQNPARDSNVRTIAIRPKPESGAVEVVLSDNGNALKYDVRLGYAYVPGVKVVLQGSLTGQSRPLTPQVHLTKPVYRGESTPDYQGVLRGFEVSYIAGDHFLRDFDIVGLSGGSSIDVVFNDKNMDDRFQATVDYALLKP
jgi:hypothetical protein